MSKKNTRQRNSSIWQETPKNLAIYACIYPNEIQKQFIYQTGGNCRFVYNKCLDAYNLAYDEFAKTNTDEKKKFSFGMKEFGKVVTELRNNPDFDFMLKSNSKFYQQSMRHLVQAFSNHKKNPEHFDFPKKKTKKSHIYTFTVPKDAMPGNQSKKSEPHFVNGNRISICTGLENVLFNCSKRDEIRLNSLQKEIISIVVIGAPSGRFFIAVLVGNDRKKLQRSETMFAFDLGLKDFMISHTEKIEVSEDGYITKTNEDVEYSHLPKLKEFKEPGQKLKAYEKGEHPISRFEHLQKKQKHHQRLLARKEYNFETHTSLKNRVKGTKFDRLAYKKSHREENYRKYLNKRATTKPFKHPKRKKKKNTQPQPQVVNRKSWQKSSNRYEIQRQKAAKAAEKIKNFRKNVHQKESTQIVRNNQFICYEDLNISGMVKNHNLAKSIQDSGWRQFLNMIEYKSLLYGRQFARVGTFFASSKLCSECGYKKDDLTLDVREWTCPVCGTHHDRDENASDNISAEGVRVYNEFLKEFYEEQDKKREETSIISHLPLSSGRRDVKNASTGEQSQQALDEASKECETV